MWAPTRMRKTRAVVRVLSSASDDNEDTVSRPRISASRAARKAPTPAASVGVKRPA